MTSSRTWQSVDDDEEVDEEVDEEFDDLGEEEDADDDVVAVLVWSRTPTAYASTFSSARGALKDSVSCREEEEGKHVLDSEDGPCVAECLTHY